MASRPVSLHIWMGTHKAVIIAKYSRHLNTQPPYNPRMYQMATWDLNTNEIVKGQWLTKHEIKLNLCDMSPNGEMFVFFIMTFKPVYATHTVISRPPYFTGIFCQEEEGCWTGGGRFIDNNTISMKPYIVNYNKLPEGYVIIDPKPQSGVGKSGMDTRKLSNTITSVKHTFPDGVIRNISTDQGKLYVNDLEIVDFSQDTFKNVALK